VTNQRSEVIRMVLQRERALGSIPPIAGAAHTNNAKAVEGVARSHRHKPVRKHSGVDKEQRFACTSLAVLDFGIWEPHTLHSL
jgi:hypothetical protein